jgi:hypothetical protein
VLVDDHRSVVLRAPRARLHDDVAACSCRNANGHDSDLVQSSPMPVALSPRFPAPSRSASTRRDPVVAIAPGGRAFHIFWAEGFRGGTIDDPVVRDPEGRIVAREGEVVADLAEGIHRHMVCSGSDSLYVLS